MDENEFRRWINRAFYADKKAKALDMLILQCRERAQKLTRVSNGSGSCAVGNSTENALIKLAEMEEQADMQKAEAVKVSSEIKEIISRLNDDDLETVLIHRFILFHTTEQTAELLNYHPNTVKNKVKKAVQKLCTELS